MGLKHSPSFFPGDDLLQSSVDAKCSSAFKQGDQNLLKDKSFSSSVLQNVPDVILTNNARVIDMSGDSHQPVGAQHFQNIGVLSPLQEGATPEDSINISTHKKLTSNNKTTAFKSDGDENQVTGIGLKIGTDCTLLISNKFDEKPNLKTLQNRKSESSFHEVEDPDVPGRVRHEALDAQVKHVNFASDENKPVSSKPPIAPGSRSSLIPKAVPRSHRLQSSTSDQAIPSKLRLGIEQAPFANLNEMHFVEVGNASLSEERDHEPVFSSGGAVVKSIRRHCTVATLSDVKSNNSVRFVEIKDDRPLPVPNLDDDNEEDKVTGILKSEVSANNVIPAAEESGGLASRTNVTYVQCLCLHRWCNRKY